MIKKSFFCLCCLLLFFPLSATSLSELKNIYTKFLEATQESERYKINDQFEALLMGILQSDSSGNFPFYEIEGLRYFIAADHSFRMINWGILRDDLRVENKAVLEVFPQNPEKRKIFSLKDQSPSIINPEFHTGDSENWYGAIYYQCIENKIGKQTVYTFLGWNGFNERYNSKLIETMQIKPSGELVFGLPILKEQNKNKKRVIFKYGKKYDMLLRYDYQSYLEALNPKKLKEIKADMIIFDLLIPQEESMLNKYDFYLPSGSTYHAFVFENGKWSLKTRVVARNPNPNKATKKPSPRTHAK